MLMSRVFRNAGMSMENSHDETHQSTSFSLWYSRRSAVTIGLPYLDIFHAQAQGASAFPRGSDYFAGVMGF